jgi:hypothetical protein
LFAGTKITIDGEDLIIPALSLGQLRNGINKVMETHDTLLAEGKIFDAMDLRGEVIFSALTRNYPDYTKDKLFDFLDLSNTTQLWLSILGQSGFAPGEAEAAKEKAPGTLSPSTEASPPLTDGPTSK